MPGRARARHPRSRAAGDRVADAHAQPLGEHEAERQHAVPRVAARGLQLQAQALEREVVRDRRRVLGHAARVAQDHAGQERGPRDRTEVARARALLEGAGHGRETQPARLERGKAGAAQREGRVAERGARRRADGEQGRRRVERAAGAKEKVVELERPAARDRHEPRAAQGRIEHDLARGGRGVAVEPEVEDRVPLQRVARAREHELVRDHRARPVVLRIGVDVAEAEVAHARARAHGDAQRAHALGVVAVVDRVLVVVEAGRRVRAAHLHGHVDASVVGAVRGRGHAGPAPALQHRAVQERIRRRLQQPSRAVPHRPEAERAEVVAARGLALALEHVLALVPEAPAGVELGVPDADAVRERAQRRGLGLREAALAVAVVGRRDRRIAAVEVGAHRVPGAHPGVDLVGRAEVVLIAVAVDRVGVRAADAEQAVGARRDAGAAESGGDREVPVLHPGALVDLLEASVQLARDQEGDERVVRVHRRRPADHLGADVAGRGGEDRRVEAVREGALARNHAHVGDARHLDVELRIGVRLRRGGAREERRGERESGAREERETVHHCGFEGAGRRGDGHSGARVRAWDGISRQTVPAVPSLPTRIQPQFSPTWLARPAAGRWKRLLAPRLTHR